MVGMCQIPPSDRDILAVGMVGLGEQYVFSRRYAFHPYFFPIAWYVPPRVRYGCVALATALSAVPPLRPERPGGIAPIMSG